MFDAGSIVGRLVLDTSGFTVSATQATGKIEQLGQNIISTTRQLTRAASAMTFLGASITAPIILAFKSAEKYSNPAREEIQKMNNAFIGLRVSIAESLLPVMHQFGNIVADLTQRWQSLSPQLRETMLRTALMTGVFLTLGGIVSMIILKIAMLIGYVIKLTGVFATFALTHPELLLIEAAIAGIVIAMIKWKVVGDAVVNTLQQIARWSPLANLTRIFQGKTPDEFFGKPGDWAKSLNEMKVQMQAWMDLFKNLGTQETGVKNWQSASKTFAQGWRDAMDKTIADLKNWGAMAGSIVEQISTNMQSIFSNFFQNLLKGDLDSAKEIFVEWGNFVLKVISDVIAQIVTAKIIAGIGGAFSFGTASTGTSNISGSSFNTAGLSLGSHAEGIDSIPYTGIYRLHEGEKVTPKYDATKSEVIELTIINQITPEAVATAMSGKEGKGVIVNMIDVDALRNGSSRRTIRRR
jgi:hypothetical protein